MMKKTLALIVIFALVSAPLYAAEPSVWKKEGDSYPVKMKNKFVFGLTNVLLGWTEILTEPYEAIRDKKNVVKGFGTGLWNGVADEVGGVIHLVTFWCPKTDIPLPQGGIVLPCCKPKA